MVVASPYTAEFRTIVAETTSDQKIFDRLHGALRICPQGGTHRRNDDGASSPLSAARHREVLDQLRRALKRKARRGASHALAALSCVTSRSTRTSSSATC